MPLACVGHNQIKLVYRNCSLYLFLILVDIYAAEISFVKYILCKFSEVLG